MCGNFTVERSLYTVKLQQKIGRDSGPSSGLGHLLRWWGWHEAGGQTAAGDLLYQDFCCGWRHAQHLHEQLQRGLSLQLHRIAKSFSADGTACPSNDLPCCSHSCHAPCTLWPPPMACRLQKLRPVSRPEKMKGVSSGNRCRSSSVIITAHIGFSCASRFLFLRSRQQGCSASEAGKSCAKHLATQKLRRKQVGQPDELCIGCSAPGARSMRSSS